MATKAVNKFSIRELLLASNLPDMKKPADLLPVVNPLLEDAVMFPANNGGLHKRPVNITPFTDNSRKLNQGAIETKAILTPLIAGIGINEEHLVQDDAGALMNTKNADWLEADESTKIKNVGLGIANRWLYADPVVDDSVGFANWYGKLSEAFYGNQIIDAEGVAANGLTSIWLVVWAFAGAYGIYPEKTTGGILTELLPDKQQSDGNGKIFKGRRITYSALTGLFVESPLYCVRCANISTDPDDLADFDILKTLRTMLNKLDPSARALGTPVFYLNQTLRTKFQDAVSSAPNAAYHMREILDVADDQYDGVPIKRLDLIRNAESQVV
jgi:hypothetical protein